MLQLDLNPRLPTPELLLFTSRICLLPQGGEGPSGLSF